MGLFDFALTYFGLSFLAIWSGVIICHFRKGGAVGNTERWYFIERHTFFREYDRMCACEIVDAVLAPSSDVAIEQAKSRNWCRGPQGGFVQTLAARPALTTGEDSLARQCRRNRDAAMDDFVKLMTAPERSNASE